MLIDTHAHIFLEEFTDDLDEVIENARAAGVTRILLPNIDVDTIDEMLEVEYKYPDICQAMMGLHPCSVKKDFEKQLYKVEEWLGQRSFVAVGEIGTDRYWDLTYWDQQQEAFRIQCELALQYDIPVAIHCRDSIDETIELVKEYSGRKLGGVFHCFTGSAEQGSEITNEGFYLGLGGVTTFKNGGLDVVVPELDESKLLLETDSPYLAPAPHRGKRNEPQRVKLIADRVAELKGMAFEEVARLTTQNAKKLFFADE